MKIDKRIISDSINYYGANIQTTVCMEELAELIQAISKEKRGKSDKNHLAEEMADVLICIEILKQAYQISDYDIDNWIEKKQTRIYERMNGFSYEGADMQDIELKPCPFCGGKAVIHVNDGVRVICKECGAMTKCLCDGVAQGKPTGSAIGSVVDAWNRRV